jgi:DNA-binding NtrC family response regulator
MQQTVKVLLADDDPVFLRLLPVELATKDLEISTTVNGRSVLDAIEKKDFDVVILDVELPDISGVEVLAKIRSLASSPEVIMLTSDSSLETGLEAMRLGAYDYITKPSDAAKIHAVILKAAEKGRILKQNKRLKVVAQKGFSAVQPILGSDLIKRVFSEAERVAGMNTTVLITGESGTGKDVLANWIHTRSNRVDEPLISVNCGAIPENLAESEFFGFEKGAFTGAGKQKIGLIEAADASTLFLDEIGEMPLSLQVKLLRFLENGLFRRVGSVKDQNSDVRIIAATNRELRLGIQEGSFREDLFYRLNIIRFEIPPLRERREDIEILADHFLKQFSIKYSRPALVLSRSARKQAADYSWPGNVRELKNAIERSVALSDSSEIAHIYGLEDRAAGVSLGQGSTDRTLISLPELEKQHILSVLEHVDGKREKAAHILGITSRTLYRKLKEYND